MAQVTQRLLILGCAQNLRQCQSKRGQTPFALLILFLALLSLGSIQKQIEDIQFPSDEERMFKTLIPDGEWGKPFYLYSKTGNPYRCFIRASEGHPIACRRTEAGEETLDALKQRSANTP